MREASGYSPATPVLTSAAVNAILGVPADVPLTAQAMARQLRVTFFPHGALTPRLDAFVSRLEAALRSAGVTILPFEQALSAGPRPRLQERLVVIAPGELSTGNLPVDHVSNLRTTTIVGIVDRPCPADLHEGLQAKLNSVVQELAWSIVQVVLFVEDSHWTVCTMNGAIVPCRYGEGYEDDVRSTVIPKLAAPVVPPHAADFAFEEGTLNLNAPEFAPYVDDVVVAAPLWEHTGLMLFHTSMDRLEFRNPFYRRIAAAYLDRRSGMSYGFLARQLAVPSIRSMTEVEADALFGGGRWKEEGITEHLGRLWVSIALATGPVAVEIPPVQVLMTRSGCDKAHLDGHRDLMLATLSSGAISFRTPAAGEGLDYRPSYDTRTIMAHALGNALVAGAVRAAGAADQSFAETLSLQGMALAHWHADIDPLLLASGMMVYGEENPPVSCSTHQAAVFALVGKLTALRLCLDRATTLRGDVHVEPCHGINVGWPTLTGLARLLLVAPGHAPASDLLRIRRIPFEGVGNTGQRTDRT